MKNIEYKKYKHTMGFYEKFLKWILNRFLKS